MSSPAYLRDNEPDEVLAHRLGLSQLAAVLRLMMAPAAVFRSLIALSCILGVASSAVNRLFPETISQDLRRSYEGLPLPVPASDLEALLVTLLVFVIAATSVASSIGLLFFRKWSRPMAVYSTVVMLLSFPFMGPILQSGWSFALNGIATLGWGAVLAMAYSPALKERFDAER